MATYVAQSCGHGYLCSSIMWAWLLMQLNHVGMATYVAQSCMLNLGMLLIAQSCGHGYLWLNHVGMLLIAQSCGHGYL